MDKSASILNNALKEILSTICMNENLEDFQFVLDESTEHGFVANVNTLTVISKKSPKKLHLFLKQRPKDTHLDLFFKMEALFYTEILKSFKEIASDLKNVRLPNFPKCFYATEDLVVLENLDVKGFKVWKPINKPMDCKHVEVIFKEYAKLHAFSFGVKNKFPEKFQQLSSKEDFLNRNFDYFMESGFLKSLMEKVVDSFDDGEDNVYALAFVDFLCNGIKDFLLHLCNTDINDVFLHGDNWPFNFMFKKSLLEDAAEVYLLDFQISRKSSPVIDLAAFISTSGCSKENFDNVPEYLKMYHETLTEYLEILQCPLTIYTWDQLLYDWKHYSIRATLYSAIINKMIIADEDELKANQHRPLPMNFDFVSRNEKNYHERIRLVLKYFYENTTFGNYGKN